MKTLNREEILAASDLKTETVEVPEWGGQVIVKTLMGFERDEFEASLFIGPDGKPTIGRTAENVRAKLIAASTVDEAGARMFTAEDVEALGKKSAKALDRVFSAAQAVNGMGRREVEALAKN